MKKTLKKWLRPAMFTLGGGLVGLGYYFLVGCATGSCPISANPLTSVLYLGLVGWLLSSVFGTKCRNGCKVG